MTAAYEQAMEQTHAMLKAAREGVWTRVGMLRSARQESLQALFDDPRSEGAILSGLIGQIREVDAEIMTLLREAKRAVGEQLNTVRRGRMARRAYASKKLNRAA